MLTPFKKITRGLLKSISNQPQPTRKADYTFTINDLLYSPHTDTTSETIKLRLLPEQLKEQFQDDIEFATASVLERIALAALVKRQKPIRIFEIGTFRGFTALVMADNAPKCSELYTLDLPPELSPGEIAEKYYSNSPSSGFCVMAATGEQRRVGFLLQDYEGSCEIKQLFGDSTSMDFTPHREKVDLFFVDGCHEYEMAKRDTLTAWSCLSPGGMIVWHDYTWQSVQRAILDAKLNVPINYVLDTSIAFAQKPE